jgi:hypothetical protein
MPIFNAHSATQKIRFGNGNWIRRFQRQRTSWRRDVNEWLEKNPDHTLKDWVKFGFAAHQVALTCLHHTVSYEIIEFELS